MDYFPAPLETLTEQFAKLPGIGRKSAQRLAFHVLGMTEAEAEEFANAILDAKRSVTCCPVCQNFSAGGLCPICASPKRDSDDLISIGTVGLIKAVSTFNASKSKTLAAYAARCIENEILMSLRAEKKQNGEVYLMEPIGTDNDGNEISLCDILGTDADHVHNEAECSMEAERLWQAIDDVLSTRERTVVKLRYGIPCGRCMAQREVAAILGISRSYVSRLEKKALTKLYSRLGEK